MNGFINLVKIRKATKKDAKEMSKIFKTEFSKSPYNEKWTERSALRRIKDYFHYTEIFVAIYKKKIMGFIIFLKFFWYDGFRILIDEIVVDSEFQNKGIGRKLMENVELIAKKQRVRVIWLYSNIHSDAANFYPKIGYNKKDWVLFEKELK